MDLPILIALAAIFLFGGIAFVAETKEKQLEKSLAKRDAAYKQLLWETNLQKEIAEKVGYDLDAQAICDSIMSKLEGLLPFSTVSAMIIKPDAITYKVRMQEPLNQDYINLVKNSMMQSLTALTNTALPTAINETHTGIAFDESKTLRPVSFFHIPLFVDEEIAGLLTITATQADFYTQEQMTNIYQITNRAMHIVSRVADVLSREQGKLTTMSGNLGDGVFMVDLNQQITVINKTAKLWLGLNQDAPTVAEVLAALPSDYDFGSKIQSAIKENQTIEEKDVRIADKIFTITITPVLTANQKPAPQIIGASVILHNVTLEKEVAKMKEDFTSIIVHELRSPLTSIKASSDLLTSQTPLTDEERKKLMSLIHEQSNKMLQEVSLILDSSKIEAGLFTIQKAKADLRQVILEKVEVFKPQAQEKFVALHVDIDPSLPQFSFDPHHIGQVITNLCSNSLKFTPASGAITVTAHQTGGTITVSVADTGAGIPKQKQHLLFSKFSQVQSSNAHAGTGLGLYFVKGVVEAHSGTIKLESEEGHGTTITFTLPIDATIQTPLLTPIHATTSETLMN